MSVCPDFDLCLEVVPDPDDDDMILIRETENPDVVVRTPRKNWAAFLQDAKDGKLDGV
jgi:hypothetical protein